MGNRRVLARLGRAGAEEDPGGAERRAAESTGLRRRNAASTSGWLGDRTRRLFIIIVLFARHGRLLLHCIVQQGADEH